MQWANSSCIPVNDHCAWSVSVIECIRYIPSTFDCKRNTFGVEGRMLNTNDFSPPNVKSMRTQPAVADDRTEFRPSLRQPPVFHPNNDFESREFAVIIYLASFPEKDRPAVPTRQECWYYQQFVRRAQHCDHNPPIRPGPRKGESMTVSYEALSSVISPEIVVNMKPLSVRSSINKEAILFLADTGASCSLIRAQLADRLTKHRRAPIKLVRLLAANGTEMRVASSLSAGVQLGSCSGEHHFLACPNLQWEAIIGRFGGLLNLGNSQMTIGSCVVGLEKSQSAEV
ncbi:hypothetical protein EG68_02211 [Paragonimus skrjabini miyazakii]|uniref:Peptidase A2 domain-containing protein n=1 Tax=Paragonimus skrjabini miyazakii TaxID=59628 RepID=A0A8S9ZBM1_9TREM|nr:hypothetical protein EG68_02211 [Paragonimus skrjabini miyazakii]